MLSLSLKDWVPGFFHAAFSIIFPFLVPIRIVQKLWGLQFFDVFLIVVVSLIILISARGCAGQWLRWRFICGFLPFEEFAPKISDKLRFLDLFIGGSRAEGNTSGAAGDSQQSTESWMFWWQFPWFVQGTSQDDCLFNYVWLVDVQCC
jgi:hypothetical protein